MHRRVPAIERTLCALAIMVLVLAQVGARAHAAATPHVRCAAHGELTEAASIAAYKTGDARLVVVLGGDPDGAHCAILDGLRHDHGVTFAAAQTVVVTVIIAVSSPVSIAAVGSTAILARAPKTSPPECPGPFA